MPWGFRVYRGKDTPSPTELGFRLLKSLPKTLIKQFEVLVLADTAFGCNQFVTRIRRLRHHVIVGIRCDRKLEDGRSVIQLHTRGQQLRLSGLKFPVHLSWYYFKRDDGKWEKRYVLCTKALKGSTITRWGRRRWQIEGFFKVAKYRFGLDRFGESALFGGFPSAGDCFPVGSTDTVGTLQMVGPILNRLFAGSLGSSPFRWRRFTCLG